MYRFYFAPAVDFRSFAKNCSFAEKMVEGVHSSPLSVGFVTVFEFAAFCTFLRIFAFFLRKFSLELVSHQSKQFLFSVELG